MGRSSIGWEGESHDGAAVGAIGGLGMAAMAAGDRLDDGQPEAGAAVLAAAGGVGAGKPLEGMGQELGRKAGPGVADGQGDLAVAPFRLDPDGAARWGDPQGVVEQVVGRLANPVGVDRGLELGVDVQLQPDAGGGGVAASGRHRTCKYRMQGLVDRMHIRATLIEPGQEQ